MAWVYFCKTSYPYKLITKNTINPLLFPPQMVDTDFLNGLVC